MLGIDSGYKDTIRELIEPKPLPNLVRVQLHLDRHIS